MTTPNDTALSEVLRQHIRQNGPMSIAEYMAHCLMHPDHGYYTTRDPFGRAGDFITAPEISQMFGELIGLCLAQSWLDQGSPSPFVLAELGPGRGTLMADILRATKRVLGFHNAMHLHLVETSEALRKVQLNTLSDHQVTWADHLSKLPQAPLYLIANEFFDALPIRQFERHDSAWSERLIGLDGTNLCFGQSAPMPRPDLEHRLTDTKPGDLVETCPAAQAIAAEIGQRIANHGGLALIIDYGDWRSLGDTLQAVQDHQSVDVLHTPGQADLTAHVDFEALAHATPSGYTKLTPQGVFLERLGITARAQALAANLTGDAKIQHVKAHQRLTHPDEMGTVFKTMAFYPKDGPPPPGLDP